MENEVSPPPDFQRFWELHNTDYLHGGRQQMDSVRAGKLQNARAPPCWTKKKEKKR